VIIEIPMNADPIKYEVDKDTGALFVDRFMSTAMHYPCNYGYMPDTLADDGDPVDVLVITPVPLIPGRGGDLPCRWACCRWKTRPAATTSCWPCRSTRSCRSTPLEEARGPEPLRLKTIQHFFEHYKDLGARQVGQGAGLGRPGRRARGNHQRHGGLEGAQGLNGPQA
jgi:inorganic pyrophosphatase